MGLCLGAMATGIVAFSAGPVAATTPGYVNVSENCWAVPSTGPAQGATGSRDFISTSAPASVLPGGQYTLTYADSGDNSVPAGAQGATINYESAQVTKIDVPAGTTVVSGPTITQQGYFYNPSTPGTHTPISSTIALATDANSPSSKVITLSMPTNITGGDNFVTPTFTITLQASSSPTSSTINSGMLDVQPPVGGNTSTDPGDAFNINVTSGGVTVNVATSCWPFPSPQPPFVTTNIIDNVNPAVTIATPGNNSQVVQNSHVAANFSCIDPPQYGNGIASCTATNDGNPISNGTLINTGALGSHNVVVTGINNSGLQTVQTSNYTVIAPPYDLVPPTVTITSPTNGQQLITGSTVNASYACTDPTDPTDVLSCTGTVANGSPISTTAGYHTFTVTATDTRGNPTKMTVGYFARTTNASTTISPSDVSVGYSNSSTNNDCSLGHTYYSFILSFITTSHNCAYFGSDTPQATWKVTAPAGNGGQIAVGDTLTVQQQVYMPGHQASSANGGYYSGPYATNLTINAPTGTVINGPITTSPTGLPSSAYGTTGSATTAAACNYGVNGVTLTGQCPSSATNIASTTVSALGSTTVGAFGSTTVGSFGSTTVANAASTVVGTEASTTVASTSNGVNVNTFTGSGTLNVASITSFPTATGNRLYVATSGGTAVLSYTGASTGKFTGVNDVSATSGTLSTGGAVNRANKLTDINGVLPLSATTNFKSAGQATVGTSVPIGTDTVAYTGTSTSAATCGTSSGCLTGVTIVSGAGTDAIAAGNAVMQVVPNINTFTGSGVLGVGTVTGFRTAGSLQVAYSGGTATMTYTGTSTTAGTCGAAACFTGVTTQGGASGTLTPSGSVTQTNADISTFAGSGILPAASVTGFRTAGSLQVAYSGGTATMTYTGTSTTAGTCGAAACFTGVATQGGASGTISTGGSVSQTNPDISTFTGGSGILPAASVTNFSGSGSLQVAYSGGTATMTYTGTTTTAGTCGAAACFTGVTTQGGASGTISTGGAINQAGVNVNTFTGSGTLSVASTTGFNSTGVITVPTSAGTAVLTYTGTTGTSFTGITTQNGGSGTPTPGGTVAEPAAASDLLGFTTVAAASNGLDVGTFQGSGTLNVTSLNTTCPAAGSSGPPCFLSPGTLEVWTTNGVKTLTYTGISGTSFTGVQVLNGGTGLINTNGPVAQPVNWQIKGASLVNGTAVSGYSWSVNANHQTSFNVTWNDSSCQDKTGAGQTFMIAGAPNANVSSCTANPQIAFGMDGVYVYVQYTVLVTNTGTITIPGLAGGINSTANNQCEETTTASGTCWSSGTFINSPVSAPGISFASVDPNPPVATLNTPTQGAAYSFGQAVNASYSCSEPSAGVTITSCTGVEDAGVAGFQQSIPNGSPLVTNTLIPNQIHTFTVTATNSEGYTSTSYSTFITIAPPPVLANQSITDQSGALVNVPFNYSGTYPANHATETIVTPPSHGTATIQPDGSINYQNDNSANASDSFQFSVSDTAGNPSNVETVNLTIQDQVNPVLHITTPPTDNSGSYAYGSVVNASYTCTDNVQVASCSASQLVDGVLTSVPNGSPIDTTSLIVGDTHSLTFTAVDWAGNTTTQTVTYKVNTPAPVANDDSATTINPNEVTIPVLSNDTTHFPMVPSTVTIVSPATYGSAVAQATGVVRYTPTSASTTSVTHDSFTYTVTDTDGQVSNAATVNVTIYPVPGISGISPTAGPLAAGTHVVITGTGFATTSGVMFGSVPALNYNIDSNTQITAVAPAAPGSAPATRDITVTTSGGTSATGTVDTYTWDPVPTVTAISPHQGIPGAGGTITVTGTGFTQDRAGVTQVMFGSTPATNVVVNGAGTQLTGTIPTVSSAGTFDVTTTTPGGTSAISPADQFSFFYQAPQVSSVSPHAGPPAGGTSVTINGSAFTGATAVHFGATAATSFTINSDSSITAVSPAGTPGSRIDVTVTGPGGTSNTVPADQFNYGPLVTHVSPSTGPTTGGTSVTISGAGLLGATAVMFGTNPAVFTVNSDSSITATAPAGTVLSTVDVTVTSPSGTSTLSASDRYTYLAPAPTVSSVSPASGPVSGVVSVTISGTGLTGASAVKFGSASATGVTVNSDSSITVMTPGPEPAGTVDVTVTTPGGTSAISNADHYTYGPAVTNVSPHNGATLGGTSVTITGSDFLGATGVSFGGTAAAGFSVNSATQITAVSPPGAIGTVNITVTTPDGTSPVVGTDTFSYLATLPTVNSVSPSFGPVGGGTVVTISGANFIGVTGVSFGGAPGTGVLVNSGTSITATSPAGTSGSTVDVTVTGSGGTSPTSPSDHFSYGGVITHVSPNSGSVTGGTSITITGSGFTGATGVSFGGTAATSYTVVSNTSVTAVAPAHAAGTVDVSVMTTGGPTPTTVADQFTYIYPLPTVNSVSPNVGKPGGGDVVTITGSGFTGATLVSFGTNPGTGLTVNSNTSITVTSPAGSAPSVVDITVTGPGGTSGTGTNDQFTYGPVVTSVSPSSGSHLGGTSVTIKGAGFTGATSVQFGSVAVTSGITVNGTGTQITVAAPAQAAGTVNVTVTAGGHTSVVNPSRVFTYF